MKIHGKTGPPEAQEPKMRGPTVGSGKGPGQTTPAGLPKRGENVSISSSARELQRIKKALAEIPDVRERKVAEIRLLIQEGRYRVDLDEVSDKILQALILGDL